MTSTSLVYDINAQTYDVNEKLWRHSGQLPDDTIKSLGEGYLKALMSSRKSFEMLTESLLERESFDKSPAEAIIVWQKERWILRFIQRSSMSRVRIQISPKSISAKVGAVCSCHTRSLRCASAKVISWFLKRIQPYTYGHCTAMHTIQIFLNILSSLSGAL